MAADRLRSQSQPRAMSSCATTVLLQFLAFALALCPLEQVTADVIRPSLSETIYFSSGIASGNRLCDRKVAERQRRKFEHLYGARIANLYRHHPETTQDQADVIHVDDCIKVTSRGALNKALIDFDATLRKIEESYK